MLFGDAPCASSSFLAVFCTLPLVRGRRSSQDGSSRVRLGFLVLLGRHTTSATARSLGLASTKSGTVATPPPELFVEKLVSLMTGGRSPIPSTWGPPETATR